MVYTDCVAYARYDIAILLVPENNRSVATSACCFLSICFHFFFVYFIGALGEEVGWSGYIIEPLQNRYGALKASLVLGIIWAVWHIFHIIRLIKKPVGLFGNALPLFYYESLWFGYLTMLVKAFLQWDSFIP